MSSHHIVREKQEPALYIHQLGDFNEEYLGQLLEWSPTLIVNSSEYEKVISLGLKVDVVLNPSSRHTYQENTRLIESMKADLVDVVEFLVIEGYAAVNIIDQKADLPDLIDFLPDINVVMFTSNTKNYAVKSGFKVWKPQGVEFKIPLTSYFETSNLLPNDKERFEVIKDGFVEFIFAGEYLFITEFYDPA
jgi:hypothetical protein